MKRAFAKVGTARFLVDADQPEVIYAEEECPALYPNERAYWHSAGSVPTDDLRKAARHGLLLKWRATGAGGCGTHESRHSVALTGAEVGLILVALDSALERGLPPRCAIDVKKARAA